MQGFIDYCTPFEEEVDIRTHGDYLVKFAGVYLLGNFLGDGLRGLAEDLSQLEYREGQVTMLSMTWNFD